MKNKFLVMGLPGSGKTTLATLLAERIGAIHFNADEVRQNLTSHLTYSHEDRLEQSRVMKWLSDKITNTNRYCVVDFICPTPATREVFDYTSCTVIWMDRIKEGRFDDTNLMFVPPQYYDFRVIDDGRTVDDWVDDITIPIFDW